MRNCAPHLLLLALAALCCAPANAEPAAAPNALVAMSSWENRHAVALTPEAREALTVFGIWPVQSRAFELDDVIPYDYFP